MAAPWLWERFTAPRRMFGATFGATRRLGSLSAVCSALLTVTAFGIGLTVLGGALELYGLLLVAKDIQRERDIAADYLKEAEQTPSFPALSFHGPPKDPRLLGSPEQPASQREIQRVASASQRAAGAAKGLLERQRAAFVGFVSTLLQGGVERRRRGVWVFVGGVILNVTGNVLTAIA